MVCRTVRAYANQVHERRIGGVQVSCSVAPRYVSQGGRTGSAARIAERGGRAHDGAAPRLAIRARAAGAGGHPEGPANLEEELGGSGRPGRHPAAAEKEAAAPCSAAGRNGAGGCVCSRHSDRASRVIGCCVRHAGASTVPAPADASIAASLSGHGAGSPGSGAATTTAGGATAGRGAHASRRSDNVGGNGIGSAGGSRLVAAAKGSTRAAARAAGSDGGSAGSGHVAAGATRHDDRGPSLDAATAGAPSSVAREAHAPCPGAGTAAKANDNAAEVKGLWRAHDDCGATGRFLAAGRAAAAIGVASLLGSDGGARERGPCLVAGPSR